MDAYHTPKYDYTAEDRKAIKRTPAPNWVASMGRQPVPHKVVHVEGELTVRACRALMRGIRHQLAKKADVYLTHEVVGNKFVKTVIS